MEKEKNIFMEDLSKQLEGGLEGFMEEINN